MPNRRSPPFAREHQSWLTLTASALSVAAFAIGWAAYGTWTGETGKNEDPGPPPTAATAAPGGPAASTPSPTPLAAGTTPPSGGADATPTAAPTRRSRSS
ncbi:hypothetical protein [Tepidiforma sp.]|jgi:hypothetical protein|uniref:hypothetical protein n=1 Tax=Tepidiforma sp. TaxID=2682230 RepID=UPI002590AD3D|nr:hypothetical protein [Tepidiforma sp.]